MILEIKNLVKTYPKVEAVRGVSYGVREGICFGLLGPNGAGKTTSIEMMEGITAPTSGEILFKGTPIGKNFKERSGLQFQETALPDYLRVREVLELFASLYQKTKPISELISLCQLTEFLDQDVHEISGGQRQRVLLALALVNDPDILFLDEPTTGLDPQARRNFWELVRTIKAQKKTIVLTTHYMEEAYELCDEIAIMDHGKIIAQGTPDSLLKKHFEGAVISLPEREPIRSTNLESSLKELMAQGVSLQNLNIRQPTLDDLFIELTGKALRA